MKQCRLVEMPAQVAMLALISINVVKWVHPGAQKSSAMTEFDEQMPVGFIVNGLRINARIYYYYLDCTGFL